MASLVSVYRGVLLYGDSGSGKSSLINAGLIPEAVRLGFAPERLRVQPRASEELVIERIRSADDDEAELLPSVLALDEESSARTVLAMDAFEERVRAACERHRPLLIFDQFEEIVTLFDEAGARDAQRRLVELFVRLLRGSLPVKVLFCLPRGLSGQGQGAAVGLPGARRPGAAHHPANVRRAADNHPGTVRALSRSFHAPAFPGPRRPSGDGAGGALRHRRRQLVRSADGLPAAVAKRRPGGAARREGPAGASGGLSG